MKKPYRKIIDRAAVARSLIELEKLFGRKPPDRNEKSHGEVALVGTAGLLKIEWYSK